MKNILLKFFTILAVAALAAGCGGRTKNPKSVKSEKIKVAVIISTLNNPWLVVLGESAKQNLEEMGYEVALFSSQNSFSKESEHFDNIIASGYKAILLHSTDANGSVANVRAAKKVGIPTFCMDREINDGDAAVSQILSDNYAGGVLLGEHFVEVLGEKGKYVELLGLVGDNNTWSRSRGFHSVVDKHPKLKRVAMRGADFDRSKATEAMGEMLQAHGDFNAVFCGNDAMAMGAYQAIVAAEKTAQVKVFGFDGAEDVVAAIKEKKITATGMQFPKTMAKIAADFADKYLKGERSFPQKMPVDVELITFDNAEQYGSYEKLAAADR